jgi:hypothetical protein
MTILPPAVQTVLLQKLQENRVGGAQPADVALLVANASKELAALRADPAKVHVVQQVLRFAVRSSWNVARFLTRAGMAVLASFLNLFSWRGLGWIAFALVLSGGVAAGYFVAPLVNGMLGPLWGSMLAAVLGVLMSALGFKMGQFAWRRADANDLYYKALNTGDSWFSRRRTDLKAAFFKLWNGRSLFEWEAFKKRYAALGLTDANLDALFRVQATKTPAEFTAYVELLAKQQQEYHRGPGDPLTPAEAKVATLQQRSLLQRLKGMVTTNAPPEGLVFGGRRSQGGHGPHRDRAAYAVLDLLAAM